jgi:hypothetical protein
MSGKLVFQSCSFCEKEVLKPSIFISNYNEVWICSDCDKLMFSINDMENGECCACLNHTNVLSLRNCIHKLCSNCFKKINFGSTINPKKWEGLEIAQNQPIWPFEIQKEDNSDPEYIKMSEYQTFFAKNFNNVMTTYDEKIAIRNDLITTRPEWMNTEQFITFENEYFKYISEFFKTVNGIGDYNKKAQEGAFCPLCREK